MLSLLEKRHILSCRGRAFVTALIMLAWNAAWAGWQVTSFEILVAKPNSAGRAAETVEDGVRRLAVDQAEILKMERFLHDVAAEYAKMGFSDPTASGHLGPITEELMGDGRSVRVYLLDIPSWNRAYTATNVGLAYYISAACDQAEFGGSILIHEPAAFTNGKITDGTYQSLAHELFHAVQAASEFKKSPRACNIGKWITEGTADAIGFDMGRRLRRLQYSDYNTFHNGRPSFLKLWGGRRYHTPLPKADINQSDDYFTSSFWRHLAEWSLPGDHPGSAEAAFDYRYLAKVFAKRIGGSGDDAELRWLNSGLKTQGEFASGLAPVFAQFTSSLGDHMTSRIPPIAGNTPSGGWVPTWLKRLFLNCPEVHLSQLQPARPLDLDIPENAVRCFRVEIDESGYKPYEVVIDNANLSRTLQKQLYIGAIGGQLVSLGEQWKIEPPSAGAGKSFVKWSFLVYPGMPNWFVISNMAEKPENSSAVMPRLNLSIPDWASSMTDKSEPPPAGGPRQQPKTRKQVNDYKKTLREHPTTQSATAAMSGTQLGPPDPGCSDAYQALNLCGPQLIINLSKDFGLVPGQGPVSAAGGLLAQQGGVQMTPGEEAEFVAGLEQMARNNTGHFINLSVPRISYGGGGAVSNARIEVSGEVKDGIADSYLAIDPFAAEVDGGKVYPPNGSVTITEYSPHILRGTFSATLVSREEVKNAELSGDYPILPTEGGISGSFTVSAPWRGNGAKLDAAPDSALMTGIRNDVLEVLLAIPEDMRGALGGSQMQGLCNLGFDDEQLAAIGVGGSCSGGAAGVYGVGGGCDCDCNTWRQVLEIPGCEAECDPKWQSWQCGPYLETGLGELDAETQRYQAEVQQLDVPDNVKQGWVYGFKIATPELRAQMWEDLEQYRQQQPERDRELAAAIAAAQAEQVERDERRSNYDAETLRYKAALEQAGHPQAEVDGLVEVFSISPEVVRQVFWDEVNRELDGGG